MKQLIAKNRKAFHEYEVVETYEAGIVLQGTEVKSLREGRVNLKDSYAQVKDGEVWLLNCHISPYPQGNIYNHAPLRPRKLLLHKRQIGKLTGDTTRKGMTLVPLTLYFLDGRVKVEIAVARGKKAYDKRETERRKDVERDIQMEIKRRGR
ncbi:MAG TPA: SsrA-binding protein SmpB [Acidobacteriota bacterium]|nr:SsrA-binding protein SmpB [Acidobacteriota bacterium]